MSKYKSKYLFSLVLGIILLFILSAVIVVVFKDKVAQSDVNPENVSLNSDVSVLIIKDKLPIADDFGKKISDDNAGAFIYYEFSVVNNTSEEQSFQLFVTKQDTNLKSINEGYIKLYLTDEKDSPLPLYSKNEIPSFVDLKYIKDKADSKDLYTGIVGANEEKRFTLRVWVADNYVISTDETAFSFEIGARAI